MSEMSLLCAKTGTRVESFALTFVPAWVSKGVAVDDAVGLEYTSVLATECGPAVADGTRSSAMKSGWGNPERPSCFKGVFPGVRCALAAAWEKEVITRRTTLLGLPARSFCRFGVLEVVGGEVGVIPSA